MDGLTKWFSFQTDPIDGKDSVPYMYGPGPAGLRRQKDKNNQIIPDIMVSLAGKSVKLGVY